jgi:serine/threonine-protein kinase
MIGRLVDGRYQVRSRIARGGMATVYLATDLRLERRVAIKVMHGHLADDSQFKERFIQEARSAARLAHPNVVNVFDQGQDSDMAYLVMEYLPGINLRDLLNEHKTLTTEQTLDILEAVLSGLSAAHKAGIVHRDLKPENVLLADDGRIKIGDFGLARAASANTATGAALLGTIAYLSPELVTRGVADTRSDIYAVGIMMYEMLAGEQPFKGEQPMQIAYQHANGQVPTPSTKNPKVPAELDELVLWATAREPDQRPRDARVMLEQLTETLEQLRTALPTKTTRSAQSKAQSLQRTVAMPSQPMLPTQVIGSDEETQVIGAATGTTAVRSAISTEATTALAEKTGKRRARGWWLFGLVVLLAGLAGGTGWYFGPGPGGTVAVPEGLVAETPEAASSALEGLGFVVPEKVTEVYSPTITDGLVVSTNPGIGETVTKGSTVTLSVSKGPKPVDAPKLTGMTEADAQAAIATAGLVYDPAANTQRFSSKVDSGEVIAAYGIESGTGDRIKLDAGDGYYDQGAVSLLISLGDVPDVKGMSLANAIATLQGVNIVGVEGAHTFSDTADKGTVIEAQTTVEGATVKPGDTLLLLMSDGPDLVQIPENIVGDTITSATSRLKALGFAVDVDTNVPAAFWSQAKVMSITGGDQGASVKRGTTITLVSNYDALG